MPVPDTTLPDIVLPDRGFTMATYWSVALVVAGEIGVTWIERTVVIPAAPKLIVQVPVEVVVKAPDWKHFMLATAPAEL